MGEFNIAKQQDAIHNPDSTPRRIFENMEEFIKFATGKTSMREYNMLSINNSQSRTWDLNAGLKGAWKLLESGWKEGADKIQEVNTDMNSSDEGFKMLPSFEPSVMGEIVEPASYFAGEPECFYEQEPTEQKIPVVKIGVPCFIEGGENADSLVKRGVAMLSLINAIEQNRIGVEVWIVHWANNSFGNNSADNNCLYEIKVKASNTPFDMDKMAFICAHPAFFRRLIFAALERENSTFRKKHGIFKTGGYGRVNDDVSKAVKGKYDLFPDYKPRMFKTTELANKWLVDNAAKVGVSITL